MKSLSVIIACLNGAETLEDALESVAGQQAECAWELILADNGSTDTSNQIFEAFAERHPDIDARIVDGSEARGKSHCLNAAIAAARGDGVIFLDADDAFAPGYICEMGRALKEHPLVAASLDIDALNTPADTAIRGNGLRKPLMQLGHEPHCVHAPGGTLGFHRDVFERVGPFDPRFKAMEDTDFCIRAHLAGYEIAPVPKARYRYRFRHGIKAIRRQTRNYARHAVLLRKLYAPRGARPFQPGAWVTTLATLVSLRTRAVFAQRTVARDGGVALGRIYSKLGEAQGDLAGAVAYRAAPRNRGMGGVRSKLKGTAARALTPAANRLWPSTTSVATVRNAMALTFDDGPDPEWTPRLLELLARYGAKATFFVLGQNAARYPDLIARIAAEGHEIGNHTWSHRPLPDLSRAEIAEELARTAAAIGPKAVPLMRPPYGDFDRRANAVVRRLGYRPVLWSAASGDWEASGASAMAEQVLANARPGAIALFHDTLFRPATPILEDRREAFAAVEQVLVARPDLTFTTVSTLLSAGHAETRVWVKRSPAARLGAGQDAPPPSLQAGETPI